MGWPHAPEDRDILYFLSQSLRARLIKDLPAVRESMTDLHKDLAHRAKALIKDLAAISFEMAQMVVARQSGEGLPDWLLMEIVRDLPRLVERRDGA